MEMDAIKTPLCENSTLNTESSSETENLPNSIGLEWFILSIGVEMDEFEVEVKVKFEIKVEFEGKVEAERNEEYETLPPIIYILRRGQISTKLNWDGQF